MRDKILVYRSGRDWRWKRVANNGRVIGASSEGYRSKRRCISNAMRCMSMVERFVGVLR